MAKINIVKDSLRTALVKMCDGNPGAAVALSEIVLQGDKIDIDNIFKGTGIIYLIDRMGIYGTDIYVLYEDICNRDIPALMAVVIATAIGELEIPTLKDACSRQDREGKNIVDAETYYYKVKERFPRFDLNKLSIYGQR